MSDNSFTASRLFWWVAVVALVLLGWSTSASAQVSSDKAAAEALFDQGVELLKAGNYEQACVKLESSQRIDPGIGTLLYLADCYERMGKTASAWATFREAASKAEAAGETERARVGSKRADALEPKLSRVTIRMADENKGIEGLQVLESGKAMNRALWGTPVPVDPGQLKVIVRAPGYESFEAMIAIEPGTSDNTLEIPPLVALPEPEEPPEADPVSGPAAMPEDQAPRGRGQRTTGFVLGGVGIVGLGVGSVFGILAIDKNQRAENRCPTTDTCRGSGEDLSNTAYDFSVVSTVGFIAGGVLLASGVVLVLTAPKKERTARVELTPTAGGAHLSLGGTF